MPKEFGRNRRVAQFIKQELSVLVQREFSLNEYGMITLSNVDVSPDLKNASIFVTALNCPVSHSELVKELNEKAAHFRHEIAHLMTSKGVPKIAFQYDESIERAQRLSDIIDSVSHQDENND